jgi:hypothetical protein
MTRSILAIALTLLLCISVSRGCLTFYLDTETGGDPFVLCNSANIPLEWNDQVSSIVVPSGWRATIYQDNDFSGESLDIFEGTTNWGIDDPWNDKLSSVVIYAGCPVLFQDYDLSGPSFVMCESGDVPVDWKNQVSSIYVPSQWTVTVYQDFDYGFLGNSMDNAVDISVGIWNAPDDQNDMIASVTISEGCPVFYEKIDWTGLSFVMCTSGDVPDNWKNRIGSTTVPSGWKVTLYNEAGLTGRSHDIAEGKWFFSEDDPSGQISSVMASNDIFEFTDISSA